MTQITNRHEIVEYLVDNDQVRDELRSIHMRGFPDLQKLYAKFYRVEAKMRNNTTLLDCVKIYNMINTLEGMIKFMNQSKTDDENAFFKDIVNPLNETMEEFLKVKTMLEECIDINKVKDHQYVINPNFSQELKEISDLSNGVMEEIE